MMLTFNRVLRYGWTNFWRNIWISSATLVIMVLALSVVAGLFMGNAVTDSFVSALESKVDVSVYFKPEISEPEILRAQKALEGLSDVREVRYVSRDRALELFRERHKDNATLLESLNELGGNPLQATLNVKAIEASRLSSIASFIEKSSYVGIIDKVDFRENEKLINKLISITSGVKTAGVVMSILLGFFVVLVTFNTIRLAIYSSREEISIMRLVGGSNWFIRGPFLVTGMLYGLLASVITLALFFFATWLVAPQLAALFSEINIFSYFISNIFLLSLILIFVGLTLGVVSSYVATRRYLKV